MKYNLLPNTDIKVSRICLGTMTYGRQNTETDGHQQIDYALERGVNFIDTAEMYPVPAEATRYGNTERIIGSWIKKSNKRDSIVLATKIAGPGDYTKHIRTTGFEKTGLIEAVDSSLERLQTDYIDLYQLHLNLLPIDKAEETRDTLEELVKEGKIKCYECCLITIIYTYLFS